MTVHIAIDDSDDRLTQEEWSSYWHEVDLLIRTVAPHIRGTRTSVPTSPYQNACWGFEVFEDRPYWGRQRIQEVLREIAGRYRQESVAWNESDTVFLPGIPED